MAENSATVQCEPQRTGTEPSEPAAPGRRGGGWGLLYQTPVDVGTRVRLVVERPGVTVPAMPPPIWSDPTHAWLFRGATSLIRILRNDYRRDAVLARLIEHAATDQPRHQSGSCRSEPICNGGLT